MIFEAKRGKCKRSKNMNRQDAKTPRKYRRSNSLVFRIEFLGGLGVLAV
jgi:hypothetical protein